jgi:Glycosyl hydrolase family 63 C-terminal domain
MNAERRRLQQIRLHQKAWRKWGPYLSNRQWGTVREDYSASGDAWNSFPHSMAASRAYRWGEDGLAGFSDDQQRLCFAVALWNGHDPILKERFFGLTNPQGNHGEAVKELFYYLDATPTHSYMKMLYKYPQLEFPYDCLVDENARRDRKQPEFDLLDSGIFDSDLYFDVFVEYAKADFDDLLMQVTVYNRGPETAVLHVLPQLWFRNTWTWTGRTDRPSLSIHETGIIAVRHAKLGVYYGYHEEPRRVLFCDNETNPRLWGQEGGPGHFKDAFHDYVIRDDHAAVNPQENGTKAAVYHVFELAPGANARCRLRLSNLPTVAPFDDFEEVLQGRRREADEFYEELQANLADTDARNVQRQALAGMIWNKQYYEYDVPLWLKGDPVAPPPPPQRLHGRNSNWRHIDNAEVLSMPDKWEYPWYAAWDLAFHCLPLALVDAEFAKHQLVLLTREWYMHPNGQLPAYEWEFGDVNPPVHAWAAWRVFQIDRKQRRDHGDLAFLERVFHKLMLNFTWWVNRKDNEGRNIFQGGFLGMDNVGVFDRSKPLPTGGFLNQADGTSWMAMYCLNLLRIAIELAKTNHVYEDIATKFFEHFLEIAQAMTNMGGTDSGIGLWDEQDQFYYDELNLPDGRILPLRLRTIVGLVPLFAVETLEPEVSKLLPEFGKRMNYFLTNRPDLCGLVSRWHEPGRGDRRLLSLLRGHRMKCLLRRMLDETEFLSDYGVRSLSRQHGQKPYEFRLDGHVLTVAYEPGESTSNLFGGNSNWRGPIWFPVNYLMIESLQKFHHYYGDDFKIECPTGSGRLITILEVAQELSRRLANIFLRNEQGLRPIYGHRNKLQTDPHFRDYLLFHEYFHGDNGLGLGAAHQTGWTGLIAKLLQPRRKEPSKLEGQEEELPAVAR